MGSSPKAAAAPRRPYALVLAGGGARGFAHAGVLRGLQAMGLAPDAVVGVSMGALVGVTYALREDWYPTLKCMDTSGFPGPHRVLAGPEAGWLERLGTAGSAGRLVWDMMVGWGIGSRSVDFGRSLLREITLGRRLEEARVPVAVGATDLATGGRVVLRSGSAEEAIYASSALAGIVPPLRRGGQVLCDGTYADSAPIDVARRLAGPLVVAVDPGQELAAGPVRSGVHALIRALEICHNQHDALRFDAADLVLRPRFGRSIDTLDFSARRECIAAGLRTVRAARAELESLLRGRSASQSEAAGRQAALRAWGDAVPIVTHQQHGRPCGPGGSA